MRTAALSLLTVIAVNAQHLDTPTIGYILKKQRAMTIVGIPGAARLQHAQLACRYAGIVSASNAHAALFLGRDSATWITDQNTTTLPLAAPPHVAAVSPQGTWFAIATSDGALTSYQHGIPQHTFTSDDLDTAALVLAISDNGTLLVSNSEQIWYGSQQTGVLSSPLSLLYPVFLPGSDTAVGWSSAAHAIVRFSSAEPGALVSPLDANVTPIALATCSDSTCLWIATGSRPGLVMLPLHGGLPESLDLPPGSLTPTGTRGVFVWSSSSLLDTNRGTPAILLLAPAAPEIQR